MRFLAVLISVLFVIDLYAGFRVAARLRPFTPHAGGIAAILFIAIFLLSLLPVLSELAPRLTLPSGINTIGFLALGLSASFFTYLLAADLLAGIGALFLTAPQAEAWRLLTFGGAVIGLVATFSLGFPLAQHLTVEATVIESPRLPKAFDGFKIVQLSDLHIGPILGESFVRRLVDMTQALEPDALIITGDLVDERRIEDAPSLALLGTLHAPFGKFFITGNHEYYRGARYWIAQMEQNGFTVLVNQSVELHKDGDVLALGGVPDIMAQLIPGADGPSLAQTFAGEKEETYKILLSHRPDIFPEAAAQKIDLTLAGHTHGGQFFPFTRIVRLFTPYVAGHFEQDGAQLFVHRGTGFWGPPLRTNGLGLIELITLRRPQ